MDSKTGRKDRTNVAAERVLRSSSKRQWNKKEDALLVQCLHKLAKDPRWKGDNGTFRPDYLTQLEKMIETKLPQSDLKAYPYIDSRNDEDKCVTASKDVFNKWVKSYPSAKGMRNKGFPHFDDFVIIFGKDRATGQCAETPTDVVKANNRNEEEEFKNANQEIDEEKEATSVAARDSQCHTNTTPTSDRVRIKRKRSRSSDGFDELVDEIKKFGTTYEKTTEEISGITTFFKQEAHATERRANIFMT
ncbi:hypothetical protein PTKIN_Ptkin06aG0118000 [Pterospermum kingtungense]